MTAKRATPPKAAEEGRLQNSVSRWSRFWFVSYPPQEPGRSSKTRQMGGALSPGQESCCNLPCPSHLPIHRPSARTLGETAPLPLKASFKLPIAPTQLHPKTPVGGKGNLHPDDRLGSDASDVRLVLVPNSNASAACP